MLHLKDGLHAEVGAFFDGKRFILELFDGAGRSQVDDDIGPAFNL